MQCKHGNRTFREGMGAKGKWQAWFCPTPKGTPDQCAPEWVRDNAKPVEKFTQELDQSVAVERQTTKDEVITRLAIAKSIIERGSQWEPLTEIEADAVLAWVKK